MEKVSINKNLVFRNLDFKSNSEAESFIADKLFEQGYVKQGYKDALLEREKQFPTGLPSSAPAIAIPHANADLVNKTTLAVVTLNKPVTFKNMGAVNDDINVQNGIAVVYELVKYANVYAKQASVNQDDIADIQKLLQELLSIFGVKIVATGQIDDDAIQQLIDQRNEARRNKDFALSDKIRDDLKAQGIILEDTPQGTRYRKE